MPANPEIMEQARQLGGHAVDSYWDEHDGVDASDLSRAEFMAWCDDAWRGHWLELVDAGALEPDKVHYRAAYVQGFTGDANPVY